MSKQHFWRPGIQYNDTQHNDIRHNTQLKGLICDAQHT
jgi:hypothetical protein